MATYSNRRTGGTGNASLDALITDAIGKLGTDQIDYFFEDWIHGVGSIYERVFTTGFAGIVSNDPAGVARVATGAGAGSSSLLVMGNVNGYPALVPGGTNGEWYLASRLSVESAITNAGDYAATLGWNSAVGNQLWLGARQENSGTNFCLRGTGNAGAGIVSTVAFGDNSKHDLKSWRANGTSYLSVDGETPVSGNVFPSSSCGIGLGADNAAAAVREAQNDWFFVAWKKSARVTS